MMMQAGLPVVIILGVLMVWWLIMTMVNGFIGGIPFIGDMVPWNLALAGMLAAAGVLYLIMWGAVYGTLGILVFAGLVGLGLVPLGAEIARAVSTGGG